MDPGGPRYPYSTQQMASNLESGVCIASETLDKAESSMALSKLKSESGGEGVAASWSVYSMSAGSGNFMALRFASCCW